LYGKGWDIECRSAQNRFPNGDNPDDNLIQISTTFQRYGDPEPYHRSVVCLDETAPVDGVEIIWTTREHEVIERWAELLREHRADVLVAYNSHQFDWRYISARCGVLVDDDTGDPLVNTELLGRLVEGGGEPKEYELNSGAYGQNKFFVLQTPGVQQVDLLQYVRREFKLASYSLDAVSKHFLGSQKLDLPAAEIFRKFLGTPGDRADIARYAVRDTELPLQLMARLCVWENLVEMANAVSVPVDYLLNRGQQIKVHSVILGKARQMGYLIPDNKGVGMPDGVKFEGATVLDARRGAYFDVVTGLDFASLVRCSTTFT
jgi:DNA polymerase delta subunit 1